MPAQRFIPSLLSRCNYIKLSRCKLQQKYYHIWEICHTLPQKFTQTQTRIIYPTRLEKKTYTNSNKIQKIWDNMPYRRSRIYKYKKLNKTKQRPDECQSAKLVIQDRPSHEFKLKYANRHSLMKQKLVLIKRQWIGNRGHALLSRTLKPKQK